MANNNVFYVALKLTLQTVDLKLLENKNKTNIENIIDALQSGKKVLFFISISKNSDLWIKFKNSDWSSFNNSEAINRE